MGWSLPFPLPRCFMIACSPMTVCLVSSGVKVGNLTPQKMTGAWLCGSSLRASTWLREVLSSLLCLDTSKCSHWGHYSCRERGHFNPPAAFLSTVLPASWQHSLQKLLPLPWPWLLLLLWLSCTGPSRKLIRRTGRSDSPSCCCPSSSWYSCILTTRGPPPQILYVGRHLLLFFFGRHLCLAVVPKVQLHTYRIRNTGNGAQHSPFSKPDTCQSLIICIPTIFPGNADAAALRATRQELPICGLRKVMIRYQGLANYVGGGFPIQPPSVL